MAFPSGPCCPLYLLRKFFWGKEEALGSRKRMPLPSLTRIRACRSQGFHPENRKAHPISFFFKSGLEVSKTGIKQKTPSDSDRVFQKKGDDILSHITAVPSAQAGLTSLFGMGRGEPRRNNHLKKL